MSHCKTIKIMSNFQLTRQCFDRSNTYDSYHAIRQFILHLDTTVSSSNLLEVHYYHLFFFFLLVRTTRGAPVNLLKDYSCSLVNAFNPYPTDWVIPHISQVLYSISPVLSISDFLMTSYHRFLFLF